MLRRKHSDMSRSRPVIGDSRGTSGTGTIVDIDQHPHPVALVEPARDLRDVGGGIAVAEIGLEMRLAALGEDLAMALVVEAVDHHPVVAGELLEDPRGLFAQRAQRVDADDDRLQRLADWPRTGRPAGRRARAR